MSDRMYSWRYNCEPFDVEYADDSVLLSPSATGLSLLLHVCVNYGLEHDIRFNSKMSAVSFFVILL